MTIAGDEFYPLKMARKSESEMITEPGVDSLGNPEGWGSVTARS